LSVKKGFVNGGNPDFHFVANIYMSRIVLTINRQLPTANRFKCIKIHHKSKSNRLKLLYLRLKF